MSSNLFILLLLAVVLAVVMICGELAALLAREKGYNEWNWRTAGRLTGLLGLIAAAGLPDRRYPRSSKTSAPKPEPQAGSAPGSGLSGMSVSPSLLKK